MNLHVETCGTGPVVLMCNGIGGSNDTWGRFGELLAEHYTLVKFEAPGCGESATAPRPYTMRTLARNVMQILDDHDHDHDQQPVHVLGYSFGGMLAQQIAGDYPHRIRRLALCSTLTGIGGLVPPSHLKAMIKDPIRFAGTTILETVPPVITGGDASTLTGKRPKTIGFVHQMLAVAGWVGVSGITAPTLVIGGTDDPLTSIGNVRKLVDKIPGARGVEIPDAGHLAIHADPERAVALVHEHLSATTVQTVA